MVEEKGTAPINVTPSTTKLSENNQKFESCDRGNES
jgi:hypothetical protein